MVRKDGKDGNPHGEGDAEEDWKCPVCQEKRERSKVFQSLPVCGIPRVAGDRDEFPIPPMNHGAVKEDTGTFSQVHREPCHQATAHTKPLAPEALVWTNLRKSLHDAAP